MYQDTVPAGTQTCMALCPTCRLTTTFRAVPGRSWFCTVCGTPHDPQPVVVQQHKNSIPLMILASVFSAAFIIWVAGMLVASSQMEAQCDGVHTCTLTLSSGSFWPMHLETGSMIVDGHRAQAFGSGFAGPFGKTTVTLFTESGDPITSAKVFKYSTEPVLDPISQQYTLTFNSGKQ